LGRARRTDPNNHEPCRADNFCK